MKEKRIVFTGDSITDCDRLWDEGQEKLGFGYVRMIREQLSEAEAGAVRIINRGHNGYTAFQMRQRWEEDCISLKPDTLTILAGVNDLSIHLCGAGGYDGEGFGRHVEWLLRKAREKTGARIILMEPFLFLKPAEYRNWMPALGTFREPLRRLSEQYGTAFIPLWDVFQAAQGQYPVEALTTDGIHLTALGHEMIADEWMKVWRFGKRESLGRRCR